MTDSKPKLDAFLTADELTSLVHRARIEDLGSAGLDVTSRVFIPANRTREARMTARQPGTVAGLALLGAVAAAYDVNITVQHDVADGDTVTPDQVVARFTGPIRSLLAMERVALNFVTHLSGIATLTARFVAAVQGTNARICDTRKTLPGLRSVQKYAVACAGGVTHRMGLYDAMLIKDNHLADVPADQLTNALCDALARARAMHPHLKFAEVEVDTLDQLERVLPAGPDMVLLDNMSLSNLRKAVAMRNREAPAVLLEASGGVNLTTVRDIAHAGVDRISVGALTHSPPALDLALDF